MKAAFCHGKPHLEKFPSAQAEISFGKKSFTPHACDYSPRMQSGAIRKTKIIDTLGPATESAEMIHRLIESGVNVFRLNMSHATHDWVRRIVEVIRTTAKARHCFIGIMMDTQGPAIRTGELGVPLDLQPGQKFTLTVRGERSEEERSVDVNYSNFVNDIDVGDVVLI